MQLVTVSLSNHNPFLWVRVSEGCPNEKLAGAKEAGLQLDWCQS